MCARACTHPFSYKDNKIKLNSNQIIKKKHVYKHTCVRVNLHSNRWSCENLKHFKIWALFSSFSVCVFDKYCFLFMRQISVCTNTHAHTWLGADQSGELAMNWTSDNGAIHRLQISGRVCKILLTMLTRAGMAPNTCASRTLIAQIYAENCIFFHSIWD